jgi:hypothetical protein
VDILDEEGAQPFVPEAHDHTATPYRVHAPLNGTSRNATLDRLSIKGCKK